MRDKKWILSYFPAAWSAHICQGLAMSILGPSQPYLAVKVGVAQQDINLIWTLLAGGSCVATVLTGFVFKRFITHQNLKLIFLSTCVTLCGVFMGLVPVAPSFPLLLLTIMVAGFFIGSLDNASNSLVLYMLGPARSPPFTQSLHAMVGLGFMLGSIVVRPFLPEESVSDGHGAVCPDTSDLVTSNVTAVTSVTSSVTSSVTNVTAAEELSSVHSSQTLPELGHPFTIVSAIHLISGIFFLCIVAGGVKMPVWGESSQDKEKQDKCEKKEEKKSLDTRTAVLFLLAFFFFASSTGMEGFFQSQIFTFGICGPHRLVPKTAALLHTVHFISFLSGRFCGVLVSSKVSPLAMITGSLVGSLLSTLLLAAAADTLVWALFLGTAAVGFFISIQFASGISWLAAAGLDLTGLGSSVVFMGAYFGWMTAPPLAGLVLAGGAGPMVLFYSSLGLAAAHLLLFLVMTRLAAGLKMSERTGVDNEMAQL